MDDFARVNKLDPERTRAVCRDFFTPDGSIQTGELDRFIAWAGKKGYIAAPIKVADLVDTRFLALARRLSEEVDGQRL
jgi:hypothetical protein